jgi:hypothetical protein
MSAWSKVLHPERSGLWLRLRRAVGRGYAAFCDRPWRSIEIGIGVFVLAFLCTEAPRAMIRVWLTVAFYAASSLVPLLRVDGAATAWSLAVGLGRIGLAALPSVLLIRSMPRHRWLWLLPLVGMLVIVSSPLSLFACATIDRWLLLACASAVTAMLTRVRFLRWTALLPFVLLWETVPSHSLMTMRTADAAYRDRLLAECALHDGTRPRNLTSDRLIPYYGINLLGDDLVLLTGEGANDGDRGGRRVPSWWLRRRDGGLQFESPSDASGNLWRGCVLEDTIWMARANYAMGAKRLPEGGASHEEVYRVRLPSSDIDFGETACDPERVRVYITEATNGGMWEMTPEGRDMRRHQVGGIWLLPKRRFDGQLVISNTAMLRVFAPESGQVVERVSAGFMNVGFDMCGVNGTVAVADVAGRLRVFEINAASRYRFAWGMSLFAPRRVAYSRDCSRIAVTSGDDHRVFIIDAAAHRLLDVFRAGPALREVAATGPREFSVADSCSITTYRW